ncbi:hypothetical protein MP228_005438 [Amoeboaphelidium protococcarum]|nr:hypothetical protein MP228_005438 [Amoeboaphelidium protococcarum]
MLEQELKPERDVKKSASQVLGDTEIQHTQPASERFALLALVCQNEGNQSDPEAVWNVLSESGILDGFDFNLLAFQREATSDQAEDCQQVPSQPAQDIVVQELQRDFGNNAADLQEPAQDDVDEFFVKQDFSVRRSAVMRKQRQSTPRFQSAFSRYKKALVLQQLLKRMEEDQVTAASLVSVSVMWIKVRPTASDKHNKEVITYNKNNNSVNLQSQSSVRTKDALLIKRVSGTPGRVGDQVESQRHYCNVEGVQSEQVNKDAEFNNTII